MGAHGGFDLFVSFKQHKFNLLRLTMLLSMTALMQDGDGWNCNDGSSSSIMLFPCCSVAPSDSHVSCIKTLMYAAAWQPRGSYHRVLQHVVYVLVLGAAGYLCGALKHTD